jgi:hypothetical protein
VDYQSLKKAMFRSLVENRKVPMGWIGRVLWIYILPVVILVVLTMKLDSALLLETLRQLPLSNNSFVLFAVALLPVNMGLDALSWFMIAKMQSPISFAKSVKMILSGRSLNVISPLGLGDAYLKYNQWSEAKLGSLQGIAADRMVKMIPTFLFGIASVLFMINKGMTEMTSLLYWILGAMLIAGVLILLGWKSLTSYFVNRFEILKALQGIQTSLLVRLLCVALLRYLIFTAQFVLILNWVGIEADLMILLMGICWIFFFKSVLPNVTILGDLTKRELSALMFFSFFSVALDQIAVASMVVWVMNIVLPAVVGLFFLSELKEEAE